MENPRFFKLTDDDHELLIDAENIFLLNNFLQLIKSREDFVITEFIQTDKPYMDQYVAAVINNTPTADKAPFENIDWDMRIVSYDFGSSWLYLKIYCSIAAADKILRDCIHPVQEELFAWGLINKWFFVRYTDESFHLRIRFKLNNAQDTGQVVALFNWYIAVYRQNGFIWKVQTDTYIPEFNRYGHWNMDLSETIFQDQSTAILGFLSEGIDDEISRWLYGMRYVNSVMDHLGYDIGDKLSLVKGLHMAYSNEFKLEKSFKNEINKKYKSILSQFIANMHYELAPDAMGTIKKLHDLNTSHRLWNDLNQLLGNYFHMFFNRLFASHNCLHELVIYDFLTRIYNSIIHKNSTQTI
jgi:lantibiotic biosynthesis protein